MNRFTLHPLALLMGLALAANADAGDAVAAGAVIIEPSTLISLGFEWPIQGDDNRNARVQVEYRRAGTGEWSQGLDLVRLQREEVFLRGALDYTSPNMFAGSVFDLREGTGYEVRLRLTDPDGIEGNVEKAPLERLLTVATRAEPVPAGDGRVYHVYPPGYSGPKVQPAFAGLLEAYYQAALGGDWSRASPPRVKAGDRILVHAGVYLSKRDHYSHEINSRYTTCCGTPGDGTYYLTQDGTAQKPIAIVAAGDGEVIFDGDGNTVLFNLMGGDYQYFEGITFRNTSIAIEAGQKGIAGSKGLTVKRSKFVDVGTAIHSDWSGSAGFTILDNDLTGREALDRLFTWYAIKPWIDFPDFAERAKMKSFYAISVYGQGHVFAYNRVRGFHDGIDHVTYGMPDDWPDTPRDRMPVAIDIYNNDISVMHDNCIETDGAMHNIRVLRNRCFNAVLGAMSPQPIFGGPVYFIRNVVYNAWWGPTKIHADPAGIFYYNNTYVGEFRMLTPASNLHLRNNLILGQGTNARVLSVDTFTNYSSSDYNGFRVNPGSAESFAWNSPPFDVRSDYFPERKHIPTETLPMSTMASSPGQAAGQGRTLAWAQTVPLEKRAFRTLKEYARATGQDRHSVLLDFDTFVNAPLPDYRDPTRVVDPASIDLRLRPGSRATDAGTVLPNVTDGFAGKAPDLGAYEQGEALPHYGPRP
ncbi:MAG: hypothetical protein ABIP38_02605 [Steroidobacteraceae bacterium]